MSSRRRDRHGRGLRGPLALPGAPQVLHTPGHTDGSCVLFLPERRALLTGDALVTLDPYTGRRGPRVDHPRDH